MRLPLWLKPHPKSGQGTWQTPEQQREAVVLVPFEYGSIKTIRPVYKHKRKRT